MHLQDDKTDSLLIYADWLEDNQKEELSIEIRQDLQEDKANSWCEEMYLYIDDVGVRDDLRYVGTGYMDILEGIDGGLVGIDNDSGPGNDPYWNVGVGGSDCIENIIWG